MERFKQLSIIILPVILCLFTLPIFAQDAVITYGNGESVTLKLKQDTYSVYIQEKESLPFFVSDTSFITAHVASLRLSTYEKEQLSNNNPNVFINPVFEDGRGNIAHVDNKINLYMYDPITATALQKLLDADELNLTVQEKFWRDGRLATYHTLAISFPYRDVSIVELTNRVNKLPGVKMAFPNLIHRITPTSSIHGITDTYYSNQWEHRKIESELAWAITMGDANIRIGILDNGVDHEHEDLTDNIWRDGQGNVMGGDFTSDGFSTGRPYGDESHGTHCAGLAAAPINDKGVVGAAPGVSLVPLKIATGQGGTARSWIVDEEGFLDAMYYSIDNDIDVLSASWGLNWWYGNVSLLNQAFEDIIDEGRNGKGIVMVYGAGNDGSNWNMFNMVSYRDEVITVGGTNPQDQRWPGSSYSPTGTIVDIAASTGWTSSNGVSNYTTDIEGSSGESSGDYVAYFGGTSGAAPVVAGAAALLLSMDNQLTHQEVKNLLYNNAEKVGGYSYSYPGNMSSELGHGRLNMFQALKWLIPLQYSSVNFTTNSFLNSAHLFGSTTISNGVTLTTITGSVTVLSGNISSASASNLIVNGKLIIESTTSLSGINIEIKPGGILFISENATLNSGNILINSGGQLIIHEGAVLSFASGQGITAYGKVTINNATLQKQGAPRWAGLSLQGSGADGSSITYSTIKGSVNGVQIVGADDTWLWQNVIEDHQNNGMYVSSANGTEIGWTTFRDNGGNGLVTDFSDVHFGIYNRFQDNTGDGLLADGSSFLHFGGVGDPGAPYSAATATGCMPNRFRGCTWARIITPMPIPEVITASTGT